MFAVKFFKFWWEIFFFFFLKVWVLEFEAKTLFISYSFTVREALYPHRERRSWRLYPGRWPANQGSLYAPLFRGIFLPAEPQSSKRPRDSRRRALHVQPTAGLITLVISGCSLSLWISSLSVFSISPLPDFLFVKIFAMEKIWRIDDFIKNVRGWNKLNKFCDCPKFNEAKSCGLIRYWFCSNG